MLLPEKYCTIMDGMENFIRSIPGARERCIAGEQGYAFWPRNIREALDAGPEAATTLGLTITDRSANEWKAIYYFDGVDSDGSPARYWRRWNSALCAE